MHLCQEIFFPANLQYSTCISIMITHLHQAQASVTHGWFTLPNAPDVLVKFS